MRPPGRTTDEIIASLASRTHGVVTRRELLAAGITCAEMKSRLGGGSLIREHRGVFRVGHSAPSVEATYLAAVRACGERAVLSGRAAAYLYGLIAGSEPPPQVTAPSERRVRGVRVRRQRRLDSRDVTLLRGIPITAVPGTIVDLAGELRPHELARACHEAGVRYGTSPAHVAAVLERRPNSPGAATLRRVMTGEERVTLSKLERRFLELLRAEGLPLPQTNRLVGGRRVDCRWPARRLTVELDGYRYHHSRHAWERDRRREREARARGDEFRRYTFGDVTEYPTLMLAELRQVLFTTPS